MKHVFVIHSNITYLAALGVVCKENLSLDNVIFVSENYYLESPIKVNMLRTPHSNLKLFFKLRELFCPVLYIDKKINGLVKNENYIAYSPMLLFFSKVIITNPLCKGFNFIEDGLAAYTEHFSFDFLLQLYMKSDTRLGFSLKNIAQRLKDAVKAFTGRTNPKLVSIPLYYNSFVGISNIVCYGFNEYAHVLNNSANRTISFEQIIQRFQIRSDYNLSNSVIWIGENIVVNYDYPLSLYLKAIDKGFISYLHLHNISHIYIKFHPHEHITSKEGTLNLLTTNGISYQVITDNTMMEIDMMKSNNITLFGIYSTLLLYGVIMGHVSFSVSKYLKKIDNDFSDIISPPQNGLFWEKVKKC